jgi:hypothetical protein
MNTFSWNAELEPKRIHNLADDSLNMEPQQVKVTGTGVSKKTKFKSLLCQIGNKHLRLNIEELMGECEAQDPTLVDQMVQKVNGVWTWMNGVKIGFVDGKPFFAAI